MPATEAPTATEPPAPQTQQFFTEELSSQGIYGTSMVVNPPNFGWGFWMDIAAGNGVNYFDVAPSYGNAQDMLGPALEPYRKKVFLACKTTERSREGSRKELEGSLKALRTDHVDLYQLHAMTTMEDVEKVCAKDGALERTRLAAQTTITSSSPSQNCQ